MWDSYLGHDASMTPTGTQQSLGQGDAHAVNVRDVFSWLNADDPVMVMEGLEAFTAQLVERAPLADASTKHHERLPSSQRSTLHMAPGTHHGTLSARAISLAHEYTRLSPRWIEVLRLLGRSRPGTGHGGRRGAGSRGGSARLSGGYKLLAAVCNAIAALCQALPLRLETREAVRNVLRNHMKVVFQLLGADDHRIVLAPLRLLISIMRCDYRFHLEETSGAITEEKGSSVGSAAGAAFSRPNGGRDSRAPLASELCRVFDFKHKAFLHVLSQRNKKSVQAMETAVRSSIRENVAAMQLHERQQRQADQRISMFFTFVASLLKLHDTEITSELLRHKILFARMLADAHKDMTSERVVRFMRCLRESLLAGADGGGVLCAVPDISAVAKVFNGGVIASLLLVFDHPSVACQKEARVFISEYLVALTGERSCQLSREGDGGGSGAHRSPALWPPWRTRTVLSILLRLKANEDHWQRELVLRTVRKFPHLIPVYIARLDYEFEPRVSVRWFGNMVLLKRLLEIPLPQRLVSSGMLTGRGGGTGSYSRLLMLVKAYIFPMTMCRSALVKGVRHENALVKSMTFGLILRIFDRFADVSLRLGLSACSAPSFYEAKLKKQQKHEQVLHMSGMGSLSRGDVVRDEIRRKLPDLPMMVSVMPRLFSVGAHSARSKFLGQEALATIYVKVLEAYGRWFPEAVQEAQMNEWKLWQDIPRLQEADVMRLQSHALAARFALCRLVTRCRRATDVTAQDYMWRCLCGNVRSSRGDDITTSDNVASITEATTSPLPTEQYIFQYCRGEPILPYSPFADLLVQGWVLMRTPLVCAGDDSQAGFSSSTATKMVNEHRKVLAAEVYEFVRIIVRSSFGIAEHLDIVQCDVEVALWLEYVCTPGAAVFFSRVVHRTLMRRPDNGGHLALTVSAVQLLVECGKLDKEVRSRVSCLVRDAVEATVGVLLELLSHSDGRSIAAAADDSAVGAAALLKALPPHLWIPDDCPVEMSLLAALTGAPPGEAIGAGGYSPSTVLSEEGIERAIASQSPFCIYRWMQMWLFDANDTQESLDVAFRLLVSWSSKQVDANAIMAVTARAVVSHFSWNGKRRRNALLALPCVGEVVASGNRRNEDASAWHDACLSLLDCLPVPFLFANAIHFAPSDGDTAVVVRAVSEAAVDYLVSRCSRIITTTARWLHVQSAAHRRAFRMRDFVFVTEFMCEAFCSCDIVEPKLAVSLLQTLTSLGSSLCIGEFDSVHASSVVCALAKVHAVARPARARTGAENSREHLSVFKIILLMLRGLNKSSLLPQLGADVLNVCLSHFQRLILQLIPHVRASVTDEHAATSYQSQAAEDLSVLAGGVFAIVLDDFFEFSQRRLSADTNENTNLGECDARVAFALMDGLLCFVRSEALAGIVAALFGDENVDFNGSGPVSLLKQQCGVDQWSSLILPPYLRDLAHGAPRLARTLIRQGCEAAFTKQIVFGICIALQRASERNDSTGLVVLLGLLFDMLEISPLLSSVHLMSQLHRVPMKKWLSASSGYAAGRSLLSLQGRIICRLLQIGMKEHSWHLYFSAAIVECLRAAEVCSSPAPGAEFVELLLLPVVGAALRSTEEPALLAAAMSFGLSRPYLALLRGLCEDEDPLVDKVVQCSSNLDVFAGRERGKSSITDLVCTIIRVLRDRGGAEEDSKGGAFACSRKSCVRNWQMTIISELSRRWKDGCLPLTNGAFLRVWSALWSWTREDRATDVEKLVEHGCVSLSCLQLSLSALVSLFKEGKQIQSHEGDVADDDVARLKKEIGCVKTISSTIGGQKEWLVSCLQSELRTEKGNQLRKSLLRFFRKALKFRFVHGEVMGLVATLFTSLPPIQNRSDEAMSSVLSTVVRWLVTHSQFIDVVTAPLISHCSGQTAAVCQCTFCDRVRVFRVGEDALASRKAVLAILGYFFTCSDESSSFTNEDPRRTLRIVQALLCGYSARHGSSKDGRVLQVARLAAGCYIDYLCAQKTCRPFDCTREEGITRFVASARRPWGAVGITSLRTGFPLDDTDFNITDSGLAVSSSAAPLLPGGLNVGGDRESSTRQEWIYKQLRVKALMNGPGGSRSECERVHEFFYDETFILPFLFNWLARDKALAVNLRRFVEVGALGFAVMSMSLADITVRRYAYQIVGRFLKQLTETVFDVGGQGNSLLGKKRRRRGTESYEASDLTSVGVASVFKEAPEISALLCALRNSITEKLQRLPSTATSFVAAALVLLLNPRHKLFVPLSRFVPRSPALSLGDIPMFSELFGGENADEISSSIAVTVDTCAAWTWLVRLLSRGSLSMSAIDVRPLKRRQLFPYLLSLLSEALSSRPADAALDVSAISDTSNAGFAAKLISFFARVLLADSFEGHVKDNVPDARSGVVELLLQRHGMCSWLQAEILSNMRVVERSMNCGTDLSGSTMFRPIEEDLGIFCTAGASLALIAGLAFSQVLVHFPPASSSTHILVAQVRGLVSVLMQMMDVYRFADRLLSPLSAHVEWIPAAMTKLLSTAAPGCVSPFAERAVSAAMRISIGSIGGTLCEVVRVGVLVLQQASSCSGDLLVRNLNLSLCASPLVILTLLQSDWGSGDVAGLGGKETGDSSVPSGMSSTKLSALRLLLCSAVLQDNDDHSAAVMDWVLAARTSWAFVRTLSEIDWLSVWLSWFASVAISNRTFRMQWLLSEGGFSQQVEIVSRVLRCQEVLEGTCDLLLSAIRSWDQLLLRIVCDVLLGFVDDNTGSQNGEVMEAQNKPRRVDVSSQHVRSFLEWLKMVCEVDVGAAHASSTGRGGEESPVGHRFSLGEQRLWGCCWHMLFCAPATIVWFATAVASKECLEVTPNVFSTLRRVLSELSDARHSIECTTVGSIAGHL